jgi:lipoprotein-anchoring transpeptidase ErfK/SrfK
MRSRGVFFAALAVSVLFSTAASAGVVISIDKSLQQMSVSVDGVKRYTWPVSTGRTGYATPSGAYTPFRLEEDHYSKEWDDAPMPHSIFFTPKGHAIHGSFETRRLGTAASHGCVRLAPANAATLFALVKEGGLGNTKVVLTGEAPPMIARRPAQPAPQGEPLELQQYQSRSAPGAAYQQPDEYQSPYGARPAYQQQYPVEPRYRQEYAGQPRYQQEYPVQQRYQQEYAPQPRYQQEYPVQQGYRQEYAAQPRYPQPGYGQPYDRQPFFGQPQYPAYPRSPY